MRRPDAASKAAAIIARRANKVSLKGDCVSLALVSGGDIWRGITSLHQNLHD